MTNKEELNQEELEKVSGGTLSERKERNMHGALIDPKNYALHLNENVVAISKPYKNAYVRGKLTWVGEVSGGCSTTVTYKIFVESKSSETNRLNCEINVGSECSFTENQMDLYEAAENIMVR